MKLNWDRSRIKVALSHPKPISNELYEIEKNIYFYSNMDLFWNVRSSFAEYRIKI